MYDKLNSISNKKAVKDWNIAGRITVLLSWYKYKVPYQF